MKGFGFALLVISFTPALYAESPFAFRDRSDDSLELAENGQPVYVYNHGMILADGVPEDRRRSSYLHPVYAPDGTAITADFPSDHHHHRGIFWTWPEVWAGGEKYDMWLIQGARQKFVCWTARQAGPSSARVGVENGWFAGDRKVVKEVVEIVAHAAESGRRRLDFTLALEATRQPVRIAGQQDGKGYGGFCIRFAPRQDTLIRTDAGLEAEDTNLAPHRWAELEGRNVRQPACRRAHRD